MARGVEASVVMMVAVWWSVFTATQAAQQNWTLSGTNLTAGGAVPGGVYSDLMTAQYLHDGDFYYRFNDLNYRLVSMDNWTYTTQLDVDASLLNHTRVALVFEGLDTVAEVAIGSEVVGHSDNMFVRYVFNVKDQLQEGNANTLQVKFESPVTYAAHMYDAQAADYIVPPKCVPSAYQGECHANHIRKMQASFSWDWGPAFPNAGIWKDWRLVGWNSLLVTDIYFSATPSSSLPTTPDPSFRPGWNITIKVWCDAAQESGEVGGSLTISLGNLYSLKQTITATVENYEAVLVSNFKIEEDQVDLWWPNGYGNQPLYNLTALWSNSAETETSSKTVSVGFRTVELNQDYIDLDNITKGRHYRVIVNNVTLFMKGSNWIPAHILPESVTPEYTRALLNAAAQTHQNCIRVWGGGIYETDVFYQIADELGILIWEDMMFACSMYPVNEDFLTSVEAEVTTQVRRLQHHPSILLWAGNNENEAALRGNWYATAQNFDQYKADYITLYVDTIRPIAMEIDDTRPFVVSSPSNGIKSEEEGYIAAHPYDNLYGDVHYYNYISDAWQGEPFPITRFASEYGYQSWPSFKSMHEVTMEEDWSSTSPMSYHRQHHPVGQEELALQVGLHMELPPQDGTAASYQQYLYLTQVHQAMAVKAETEFYRRWMSSVTDEGEGYTSGALYWQLNDIWQGASWASIEYGGRWKMLHYYAKNFFAPVITSTYMDTDNVKVYVVSDEIGDVKNAKLTLKLHRYDQLGAVFSVDNTLTVAGRTASEAFSLNLESDLALSTHCQKDLIDLVDVCFLTSHLALSDGSYLAPDNFYLLGKPKDAPLPDATIQVTSILGPTSSGSSDWTFTVTVNSDAVALFVWLETDVSGVFSQNGFVMTESQMEVLFYADQETTTGELQASLTVMSLTDTLSRVYQNQQQEGLKDSAIHPNDIRNVFIL
ncbi:hypothetical protein Pmani_037073 [Petrolisthes manimaculis]|uniref:beta-mannosidase n=1 Tax=Petrolisthes manimaculis TaxID=1843537 RepID=A0AAE1NIG0_9EUCA|nr:hypothetical protein Pmani_037073 [Petrolisthes manimaculis]